MVLIAGAAKPAAPDRNPALLDRDGKLCGLSVRLPIYREDATPNHFAKRLIDIATDGVRDLT